MVGEVGCRRQVELGVICVAVELDSVFMEKIDNRKDVDDEKEEPKNRTLMYMRRGMGVKGMF